MQLHAVNLLNWQWRLLNSRSSTGCIGLIRHSIVVTDDDRLLIFGGSSHFRGSPPDGYSLAAIPAFNLNTQQWFTLHATGNVDICRIWPFAATTALYNGCVFLIGK